jgi:hypothetical protein
MDRVTMYCVKPYRNVKFSLVPESDDLLLCDGMNKVVASMPASEANQHIQLPSFWSSRYIVIKSDAGETLCFDPNPKVVGRLRELLDDSADRDPDATAAAMQRRGIRDLAIGGGLFLLGVAVTIGSFAAAGPGGTYVITTGLIVGGLVEMIRGIIWLARASRR